MRPAVGKSTRRLGLRVDDPQKPGQQVDDVANSSNTKVIEDSSGKPTANHGAIGQGPEEILKKMRNEKYVKKEFGKCPDKCLCKFVTHDSPDWEEFELEAAFARNGVKYTASFHARRKVTTHTGTCMGEHGLRTSYFYAPENGSELVTSTELTELQLEKIREILVQPS